MIRNLAIGVREFTSNAFLVTGERTVLVDAGASFDVVGAIREHVDDVDALVLTHTHPDHVGNVPAVRDTFGVDVFGFDPESDVVDRRIADGDVVTIGDGEYIALHTPGHKDDHLCLYEPDRRILFSGDLIFPNGGFGRTDLPEGNRAQLLESIDRVLDHVDESLRELHAGHGKSVTSDAYRHVAVARQVARTY